MTGHGGYGFQHYAGQPWPSCRVRCVNLENGVLTSLNAQGLLPEDLRLKPFLRQLLVWPDKQNFGGFAVCGGVFS